MPNPGRNKTNNQQRKKPTMFTDIPTDLFPGYEYKAAGATVTANSIVIPLTALPGLTSGEAHATTGDPRKIIYELNERIYTWFNALPADERPSRINVSRSSSVNETTSLLTRYFQTQAVTVISGQEVADEPT